MGRVSEDRPLRERAEALYRALQDELCAGLERLDGVATFGADAWTRPEGGGGLTRVLEGGAVLEKGAVNVSAVWGPAPPALVEHLGRPASAFFATGVSMIFHPRNPHAPTMHANLRYFEAAAEGAPAGAPPAAAWFGGGCDLTPYYLYEDDVRHFHAVVRAACDRHAVGDYPAWKAWCDRYFFLPHRGEARGVGGVFFDHLGERLEEVLALQADLGRALLPAYAPLVERRAQAPFGPEQERWHLQRRGRYVEFNLLHDRGTQFGLKTGGRTESILVSLPARCCFGYRWAPAEGTPHAEMASYYRPLDWA